MAVTPAACASCVFGAVSSSLLSLPYHEFETINVTIVPHITVYTNGSRSTSTQTITSTETDFIGTSSGDVPPRTYTDLNDLTWTVGDATLTYPTTYVQYLGFAGAPAQTGEGQTCAEGSEATAIALPSSTVCASFIYPLADKAVGQTALPAHLLEYLGGLPPVSAQFYGQALAGCAPLGYAAATSTSGPSSSGLSSSVGSYSTSSSAVPISSTTRTNGNFTWTRHHPEKWTAPIPNSYSASHPGLSSVNHPGLSSAPAYATVNSHTTAYVVQTITGRALTTTESHGGSPGHDHHTDDGKHTQGYTTKHTQAHTTKHGGDSTTTAVGIHNDSPHHSHSPDEHHHPGGGHQHEQTGDGGDHHESTAEHDGGKHTVFGGGDTQATATSGGAVVIAGHTLHRGETVTFGSSASEATFALQGKDHSEHLVVNGKTYNGHVVAGTVTNAPSRVSEAVITTHGHTITAIHSGDSIILVDGTSSKTVVAGSKATFEGQTIRVPSRGGSVVVNGHEAPLTTSTVSRALITAGGHTITVVDAGKSVILEDGTSTITMKDGTHTKFEGQIISIGPSGSAVVVNGDTIRITSAAVAASSTGIGGYVANGLGGGAKSSHSVESSTHNAAASAGLAAVQVLGIVFAGLLSVLGIL